MITISYFDAKEEKRLALYLKYVSENLRIKIVTLA
jgi:hypothetical protein